MSEGSKVHEALDRPASQQERKIVRWLLEHGDPKYLPLASQIDALRVVSKCTCGCPTVHFALEGDPSVQGTHLICDCGATVDDQEVGVLLFACEGKLSMLEVYSYADNDKPFGLPKIESLYTYQKEEITRYVGGRLTTVTLLKRPNDKELPRASDADDSSKS